MLTYLLLAIEVDGENHYGNTKKDKKKDNSLNELGITVLRFDDLNIVCQLDKVPEKIDKWIDENKKLTHPKSDGQAKSSRNKFRS